MFSFFLTFSVHFTLFNKSPSCLFLKAIVVALYKSIKISVRSRAGLSDRFASNEND